MLPVKAHTEMLAEQFLASSYQSQRVDNETNSSPPPPKIASSKDSTPPPKIAEEQTLPRVARIRLTQLRTGYCPLLNSYLSRICNNVANR